MNQFLRNAGFGLIILGILLILFWAIEPLRLIWPWLRGLPFLIRIGVIAAAFGLAILLGSLISERIRDREADKSLRDEF
jgi:hypothetical protein